MTVVIPVADGSHANSIQWGTSQNGYFELYHPNGNIKCRGNYVDHRPSGNWAERFAVLTGWGHQFMSAISHLIRTQAKSLIPSETHFFHLKLNFPGGFVYRYSFHFSKKPAYY